MKCLISIIILVFSFSNTQKVMDEFHLLASEQDEKLFIEKYVANESPTIQGYICAVEMKQAEYVLNPITKLKIFNRSKKKLNELIVTYPTNINLRYLRLLLQERTPSILGYNDKIQEDKSFLEEKINTEEVTEEFKNYIYKNTSI